MESNNTQWNSWKLLIISLQNIELLQIKNVNNGSVSTEIYTTRVW